MPPLVTEALALTVILFVVGPVVMVNQPSFLAVKVPQGIAGTGIALVYPIGIT